MAGRESLGIVRILLDQRRRRIERRTVAVIGVEIVVGVDQRAQVNGGLLPVRTTDLDQIIVLIPAREGPFVANVQPLEQLMAQIDTPRDTLYAAVLDDTFRIVVTQRGKVTALRRAVRNRDIVVLVSCRAGDFIDPIGTFPHGKRVRKSVLRQWRGIVERGVEIGVVVAVECEFRPVHQIQLAGQL